MGIPPANRISIKLTPTPPAKSSHKESDRLLTQQEMDMDKPDDGIRPNEDALHRLAELRQATVSSGPQENLSHQGVVDLPDENSKWSWEEAAEPGASYGIRKSGGRTRRTVLISWVSSLIGAVIVGLCFGFLVLALFRYDQPQTANLPLDTRHTVQSPNAGSNAVHTSEKGSLSLNWKGETFSMVQVGVFTETDAMRQLTDTLKAEGYPSFVYELNGKRHVFVALAANRDEVLGIGSLLKERGLEVFVKEVQLPDLNLILEGKDSQNNIRILEDMIRQGMELSRHLSLWSSKALNQPGENSAALTASTEQELLRVHRAFLTDVNRLDTALPAEWKPYVNGMVNGLNQSVTALPHLKEKQAASYAWQVQAGVLSFLQHYAALAQQANAKQAQPDGVQPE